MSYIVSSQKVLMKPLHNFTKMLMHINNINTHQLYIKIYFGKHIAVYLFIFLINDLTN